MNSVTANADSGEGRSRSGRVADLVLIIGAMLVVVGSFAPWVSSLGISANSWDLRDIAGRLGYGGSRAFEIGSSLWVLVPVSLVASAALAWFRFRLSSVMFAVLGALYAGIVAFAVLRAPDIAVFTVEWGVWVTLVGSLISLAGAAVQIYARFAGHHRQG